MNHSKKYITITAIVASLSIYFISQTTPETPSPKHRVEVSAPAKAIQNTQPLAPPMLEREHQPDPEDTSAITHYSHTFSTTQEYESQSQFGILPPHMSDVRIEELAFDEHGNLIINEKIKTLIEFFLLAKDIEGKEQAIERLKEYLNFTLPSPAKEQALAISEQYLLYKDNLEVQQFSDNTNLSDEANLLQIKYALEHRKNTRRHYMGHENSQAIFGYEERYDNFSIKRLEINANHTLSASEKDKRIAQAEQDLPENLAKEMRYKREQRTIEHKITQLKNEGNHEAEIYTLRQQFYGEKVAQRMAYLEDNSPVWQQRVNDFYAQQSIIFSDTALTDTEKNNQAENLREQSFTYKEQVKLAVQSIRS